MKAPKALDLMIDVEGKSGLLKTKRILVLRRVVSLVLKTTTSRLHSMIKYIYSIMFSFFSSFSQNETSVWDSLVDQGIKRRCLVNLLKTYEENVGQVRLKETSLLDSTYICQTYVRNDVVGRMLIVLILIYSLSSVKKKADPLGKAIWDGLVPHMVENGVLFHVTTHYTPTALHMPIYMLHHKWRKGQVLPST